MLKMHRFTIGLFDKDAKIQLIDTATAMNKINAVFCTPAGFGFPGITMMNCYGAFTHEDGTYIFEPSIRVEVAAEEVPALAIASVLKAPEVLNQESIMYEFDGEVTFL